MATKLSLREIQEKQLDAQTARLSEGIRRRLQIDPEKALRPRLLESANEFDWRALRANVIANEHKLREANAETAFGQLLRYGVQTFMFDAYKSVQDFVYLDLVQTVNSKNRQEWYAPMFGVEIPKDVPQGGKYQDSKVSGLDVSLVNKKVGRMFTVERELIDDDQTGQIEKRATGLGERLRYKEEADVMGVDVYTLATQGRGITGVAGTSYTSAIGNAPSAGFAALTQNGLETADIALHNMVDPTGNRILVKPSVLLVSPSDKFNGAKLLNSVLQPSMPGVTGAGAAGAFFTGGQTAYTGTINPLQGMYALKVSRFLPPAYWYLMEPKTSIVFQDRDPLELLMEARDAGTSFEKDVYRWRLRRRYQTQVLEYRYIYCGNGQ